MRLFFTMTAAVAVVLCIGTALAEDDKTKIREIKGWGVVTDPNGDCTVKEDKGKLTIMVPGKFHDLHPDRAMNAPRVLREVEGDFTATVKVTCALTPGMAAIPGRTSGYFAGLLLWAGDKQYLRLERNAMRAGGDRFVSFTPLFEYWKDGRMQPTRRVGPPFAFKADATWFKFERRDGKVTAHVSHDGKDWAVASEANTELPRKVHIGVAALNTSDTPFLVEFGELKVEAAK